MLHNWEQLYIDYVNDTENGLKPATTIEEFKNNLRSFKTSFPIRQQPGALLYRSFIVYLLNEATNAYLYSLYKSLEKR